MKLKLIILTLALASSAMLHAQTLAPKVIAASGGYYKTGGVKLSWTLGETMTTALTAGGYKLSQGFQQVFTPVITSQPQDSTVCGAGNNASFGVTARNATSYQWQRDSVDISNGHHWVNVLASSRYSG